MSCMNINVLTFKVLLDIVFTNSVSLSDCIVIGFLSRNKYFNAVIEVPILSFSGKLQAYRANMSDM